MFGFGGVGDYWVWGKSFEGEGKVGLVVVEGNGFVNEMRIKGKKG